MPDISLPGPNLIKGYESGGQGNYESADAPWQALGSLGGTISNVADQGIQMLVRAKHADTRTRANEMELELSGIHSAFTNEIAANPGADPKNFLPEYAKRLDVARKKWIKAGASPDEAEVLNSRFNEFAQKSTYAVERDSLMAIAKNERTSIGNLLDHAERTGDEDLRTRALEDAKGVFAPAEQERIATESDQRVLFNRVSKDIDNDPLLMERELDSKEFADENSTLGYENIEKLKGHAETKANRYRSDFSNEMIVSGQQPTLEELQHMADAGQLSPSQHAQWATKVRNQEVAPVSDPAIYNEAYGQIVSYDPAKDPTGRTEATLRTSIAAMSLPPAEIQQLNSKLTDMVRVGKAQPKNQHEAAFSGKIGTDFTRGDFGKYRFPVDSDNDPSTPPTFPINPAAYDASWKLRGKFEDQWRGIIAGMPADAKFEEVSKAYDALKSSFKGEMPMPDLQFSKPKPLPFVPGTTYQNLPGKRASFGGQSIKGPGIPFTGAAATAFGGANDPDDNGLSAFGGKTGEGGKEGTAIPQAILAAQFPGRPKEWLAENVRTVVVGPDGVKHTMPVVDLGTAESVWQRAGRPTLDLTPGAVKRVGGKVSYTQDGKMSGVKGLDSLDFSVVSIDTGGKKLTGMSWNDARQVWFDKNRPTSNQQIDNSLIALRDAWAKAQMDAPPDRSAKLKAPDASVEDRQPPEGDAPEKLPGRDPDPDAWKTQGPIDVPEAQIDPGNYSLPVR